MGLDRRGGGLLTCMASCLDAKVAAACPPLLHLCVRSRMPIGDVSLSAGQWEGQ